MKRFITYLFHYEDGNKCRNIGFIRTDLRNDVCKMELHIQNLGRFQGKAQVFLLAKGQRSQGIELGWIVMTQGKGDGAFSFSTKSLMESCYDFLNVCGVGIRFGNQYYAASFWEDEVDDVFLNGKFTIWVKEQTEKEAKETAKAAREVATCEMTEENTQTQPCMQREMPVKEEPHEKMIPDSKPAAAQEESEKEDTPEEFKKEDIQEEMQKVKEKSSNYRKIDITGIRTLPKRNWYLCNNSFLLHGFFNYHYLIVKEKESEGQKKRYLGVPGYYERQEKVMAMMFGFPEFETEEGTEPVKEGVFGYWLCLLDT